MHVQSSCVWDRKREVDAVGTIPPKSYAIQARAFAVLPGAHAVIRELAPTSDRNQLVEAARISPNAASIGTFGAQYLNT